MKKVDPTNREVFLDLAWGGTTRGRVHITLSPDTPEGRQFVLLCTGQCGPSFKNTNFFRVDDRGGSDECVYGGDYQCNDGSGETELVENVGNIPDTCCNDAGSVCWEDGSKFSIATKQNSDFWEYFFGKVSRGLEVVQAAIDQNHNISNVKVVDCGVLLTVFSPTPRQ